MLKTFFFIVVSLFSSVQPIYTQNSKPLQFPSLAIGAGVLSYHGDVNNKLSAFGRIRTGYSLTLEKQTRKYSGFSLSILNGKLGGSVRGSSSNLNFESKIFQADINLVIHFKNDLFFKKDSTVSPYILIGLGFLKFDTYGDLMNKNGLKYYYWNDCSIRDIPQNDPSANSATIIQRDFSFETKLTDTNKKYNSFTLAIPLGAGIKLKVIDNIDLNIGATYYFTFSDWIDNIKTGFTDPYLYSYVSLQYNFIKKQKKIFLVSVDFSSLDMLDSDADGIMDTNDKCQGTLASISVDKFGCPIDSDSDGIPDYLDKEENTKRDVIVDQNGRTLTKKMIADQQKEFESGAADRSKNFNANPSLEYLKELESITTAARKNNPDSKIIIPAYLKSADTNNDAYISPEEIKTLIDGFFEEGSNFTVEQINELINFFFEQ